MKFERVLRTVVAGLIVALTFAATSRGQTQPATRRGAPTPAVLRLWPADPPATQPYDASDDVTVRGTAERPSVAVKGVRFPSLTVYPAATAPGVKATPAVVVCPGGGYTYESATNEGTEIGRRLAARGITAFVLKYRLPDGHPPAEGKLPVPQQDVLRAVQIVRAAAGRWGVDPGRVGVMGFSAGGHLAATAATMYDQAATFADQAGHDDASHASARPDFAVLVYPVITLDAPNTHGGSRRNLIGEAPDVATVRRFSADGLVTPRTPPLFIVHAEDDTTVPVANAHLMADAAERQGVPHRLVIFPHGGHGFGLGNNADTRTWFDTCLAWLASQKLIDSLP